MSYYRLSGWKQQRCIILNFWKSSIQNQAKWAKVKPWTGLVPWEALGDNLYPGFSHLHRAPCCVATAVSIQSVSIHRPPALWLVLSCQRRTPYSFFSLVRTLLTSWLPGSSRFISDLRILNLMISAKTLLPYKLIYSQFSEWGHGHP